MSDAPKLLPCPFCGDQAKTADWPVGNFGDRQAGVTCDSCGATFGASIEFMPTPEEIASVQIYAIAAWNRRAALSDHPAVKALVADAEARGMERALETMKTAGDSAVTEAMGQRLCCNGQDCGCHGATVEQYLEHLIRAEAAAIRKETT